MDNTSNWEFAAVVAAVAVTVSGLLIFTLTTILMSWRVFDRAARAAQQAAEASTLVQDVAREMAVHEAASTAAAGLAREAQRLGEIRTRAQGLVEQQAQLQEAVRNLVEAGVLQSERTDGEELKAAINRLDEHMGQLAAAIAAMARRDT